MQRAIFVTSLMHHTGHGRVYVLDTEMDKQTNLDTDASVIHCALTLAVPEHTRISSTALNAYVTHCCNRVGNDPRLLHMLADPCRGPFLLRGIQRFARAAVGVHPHHASTPNVVSAWIPSRSPAGLLVTVTTHGDVCHANDDVAACRKTRDSASVQSSLFVRVCQNIWTSVLAGCSSFCATPRHFRANGWQKRFKRRRHMRRS